MADKTLTFTPIAGGTFPDGYANRLQGGFQVVADTTARDAIPSYRRVKGMLVHVLTDNTIYRLTSEPSASPTWAKVMVAPAASGDAGKVLTVVGSEPAWAVLNALPDGGGSGKFLGYKSDNSGAEWKAGFLPAYALPTLASATGYLKNDGTATSWSSIREVPSGIGAAAVLVASSANVVSWSEGYATPATTTAKQVLLSNASAAPSYLANGTEGQVLRQSASSGPAWATPGMRRLPLVAGSFSTDVGGASSFSVATLQFRPSEVGFDVRTAEKVRFRAFASTTSASNKAIIELYAAGTLISTLETTSTSTAQCSVTSGSSDDVTAALSADKLLEVRVRLATDASATSSAFATIKSASLVVAT